MSSSRADKDGVKNIVIATIGSLGDLHPCLALGLELSRRGHRVTIAATAYYREKVEGLGLGFRAIRPDWDPTDSALIGQCEELKSGPEILFRRLILPHLRATYEDLLAAAAGSDLMIAGELVYAAPLVAEKLGLRWASAILSPCSFFSAHDPSLLVNVPWLIHLRGLGAGAYKAGLAVCKLATRHWWTPVRGLRREMGLREECDPVFRDKFSPDLVLALFSRSLAEQQPDWPQQTRQTGFVFFDKQSDSADTLPGLVKFLAAGDAPIVFTMGSTAVHNPGNFYSTSLEAARLLGRRAVLLGASPAMSSTDVLALPYAPYSLVFPHAAAIVHQGGSGTTGQALRAGRPVLIVPYGWDQPDNGMRIQRSGTGLTLARRDYSATTAATALERLLTVPRFAARAEDAGSSIRADMGLLQACNAIEEML